MKKLFSEIPYIEGENIVLRQIREEDAPALAELSHDAEVYRYLPTFLFEQRYDDAREVVRRLYTECFKESIILGIYKEGNFCGLAEMYGFRDEIHKVSVGYRLLRRCWGRGIATEALKLMVSYLYGETDIQIITASTMPENKSSAAVLRKNGFELVISGADEDWGYPGPVAADKWIR